MSELTPKQQTVELIRRAQKVLLLTHALPDGDGVGSLIALKLALEKMGKTIVAVAPDPVPTNLRFLPKVSEIAEGLSINRDFIISIDCREIKIAKLGYKQLHDEEKLNIVITPQSGTVKPELISYSYASLQFDLIIALDTADLDRLGRVYEENAPLFYEVPIINLDHHATNSHFGKVNWVEMTATSTAEILVSLFESLGRETPLLDEEIATALLTGIIYDTNSFQNLNTTPKSLTVAAQLVAAGGRQQEIVREIYKTKTLSTLKLWGRVLSGIIMDSTHRFIYSTITKKDLLDCGADESEIAGAVDELLKTVPNIDFAFVLSERRHGVHASFRAADKNTNVAELVRLFGGGGHEAAAAFQLKDQFELEKVQGEILEKIRDWQAKRLALNGHKEQIEELKVA